MLFGLCFIYLLTIGLLFYFAGRLLPRDIFDESKFPYKSFPEERDGDIYNSFRIKEWKDKLPDMSRISGRMFPKKVKNRSSVSMSILIKETCVAELTHKLLILAGVGCIWLWPGVGGLLFWVLWILGNLPFIAVQRYNRPHMIRAYRMMVVRENR